MPSRASKRKKEDFAETAFRVVAEATGQRERTDHAPVEPLPPPDSQAASAAAAALSRLGASKGGKARAESMSAKERSAIAKKAAAARWAKGRRKRRE